MDSDVLQTEMSLPPETLQLSPVDRKLFRSGIRSCEVDASRLM